MPLDHYASYEASLQQLLAHLGDTHPRYDEALTYQHRLLENLAATRRYGDTETRRAERAEVIDHINSLARDTGAQIFLSMRHMSSSEPPIKHVDKSNKDVSRASSSSDSQLVSMDSASSLIPNTAIIVLAVVGTIISIVWLALRPDFEPLLALITSLTVLVETLVIRKQLYRLAIAVLVGALVVSGTGYLYVGRGPYETNIAVRVADPDGKSVARASVILLYGGEIPIKQATDSNGIATFTADSTYREARLVVEGSDFQVHEEVVNLARSRDMTVNLRPLDEDVRTVIVRVVHKIDLSPINGAEVLLITGGEPFSDFTDENGLATFNIQFNEDVLDADLTVEADGSDISNQNISLRPDLLQEVRLDVVNNTIDVAPISRTE